MSSSAQHEEATGSTVRVWALDWTSSVMASSSLGSLLVFGESCLKASESTRVAAAQIQVSLAQKRQNLR